MNIRWTAIATFLAAALSGFATMRTFSLASDIKSDEHVVFFPTAARIVGDGTSWVVPIHGWIFESNDGSTLRRAAASGIRRTFQLDGDPTERATFRERIGLFLRDNERGKRITVRIGGQDVSIGPSAANGHFTGEVTLRAEDVEAATMGKKLQFRARTVVGDNRDFSGVAHLIKPEGVSVVSDIDDTIKVTEVADITKMVENTFMKPFRAVEGMAEVYRRWARAGVEFHFVSSSPWQLYEPLIRFARGAGFPDATYHLVPFRLKDASFLRLLLADPQDSKVPRIEQLLSLYPRRVFVLVGDSGQQDPEAYALVAKKHPDRIARIYIRDVTGEPLNSPRYTHVFEDVPSEKWRVFVDPETLQLP